MSIIETIDRVVLGDPSKRFVKKLKPTLEVINSLEEKYKAFSDEQLRGVTVQFRQDLVAGKTLDDLLPQAFAAVREAGQRALGMRHYDVQMYSGMVLHQGNIAEQKTGEGKTLAATLPLYLNALESKGVHLVTVNDYLSRRDCGWMAPLYHALGMSVGVIIHQQAFVYDPEYTDDNVQDSRLAHLKPIPRKAAYDADITYGTNNEFGFDYLRDNMVQSVDQLAQRGLHYAIVDEVDSILIDEARTPLIISAPDMESTDKYAQFAKLVVRLESDTDYNVDEKMRATTLTEAGVTKMEKWLGVENMYTDIGISDVHHIEQALRAHALFGRDKDYVVKDGEVIIVDEFTGRMMFGRRYSEGLHQAIEAKEGVTIQRESKTLATITFQNYFRMFKKLAGMTGTAETEKEEFLKIYGLDVVAIPTNKLVVRHDRTDRIYKNEAGKFQAVVAEIKTRHEKGQPVLIGTISIEKNEMLSTLLSREGISHELLNAKQHEREAQVIAQAGRVGAVTVATNMAGRGVDIKLGGDPVDPAEEQKVKDAGGLMIIGTERHEARRIDNQLRGRGGRQGDPGESQFYVSTDDDLMRIFGASRIKKVMETLKVPDDMPIENGLISKSLETAQKKVEGHNFDTRKHLVEYDDVLNKQRTITYKRRLELLNGGGLKDRTITLIQEEIEDVVGFHTQESDESIWDLKEIYEVVSTIFAIPESARIMLKEIRAQAGSEGQDASSREKLIGYLFKLAVEQYNRLETEIIKASGDEQAMRKVEKGILLRSIDLLWIEHLEALQHLRTGIGLRGYGQRDPLIEYQKESYTLYREFLAQVRKQVVYAIFKVGVATNFATTSTLNQIPGLTYQAPSKTMSAGASAIRQLAAQSGETPQQREVASRETQVTPENSQTHYNGQKIGRNDLCPCGSGKKFKKCHGN